MEKKCFICMKNIREPPHYRMVNVKRGQGNEIYPVHSDCALEGIGEKERTITNDIEKLAEYFGFKTPINKIDYYENAIIARRNGNNEIIHMGWRNG